MNENEDIMTQQSKINPEEFLNTLWKDIWDINVAMLITYSREGEIRARPMITQAVEEPNIIWFADRVENPQNAEIMKNSHVNLTYTDHSRGIYISLCGRAQVVTEQVKLEQIVTKTGNRWVPDKSKDPHLAALQVRIVAAEYWCAEKGLLSSLTEYLSSLTSDEKSPAKRPEHEKIQLESLEAH